MGQSKDGSFPTDDATVSPCKLLGSRTGPRDRHSSDHPTQEAPVTSLDAPVDQQALAVGGRIRALRRARGLTLVQLAGEARLSHPFLSQLERGLTRPSMVSLEKIARALGSSQVELLAPVDGRRSDDQPGVVFVSADDGSTGSYGQASARLLTHGDRPFHPMEMTGYNRDPGEFFRHAEDEFVHVLAGRLQVDLGPEGTRLLETGDSLYYVGGTPHRWNAVDDGGYRLFVVKQRPEPV